MARSCLAICLLLCLLSSLFLFSCSEQVPENSSTPEQNGTLEPEQDAADVIEEEDDSPEEDEPRVPPEEENPASDFTWQTGEDNTVTITKYVGTDTTVVVPAQIQGKDVAIIGRAAFALSKIESIFLPDNVTTIDVSAFEGCVHLEKVQFPPELKEISAKAFYCCSVLETLELPDKIETLGSNSFGNCTSLFNINLPKSLNKAGSAIFFGCTALKSIQLPKSLEEFSGMCASCSLEEVVLEDGITKISDRAFANTKIKKIIIPASVKVIEGAAFYNCVNLESISLSEGLVEIGDMAFFNTQITTVVLPKSIKNINRMTFWGAKELQNVKFEGNAPPNYYGKQLSLELEEWVGNYTVFCHKGAAGFTSPEWNGFKTEIW